MIVCHEVYWLVFPVKVERNYFINELWLLITFWIELNFNTIPMKRYTNAIKHWMFYINSFTYFLCGSIKRRSYNRVQMKIFDLIEFFSNFFWLGSQDSANGHGNSIGMLVGCANSLKVLTHRFRFFFWPKKDKRQKRNFFIALGSRHNKTSFFCNFKNWGREGGLLVRYIIICASLRLRAFVSSLPLLNM